MTWDDERTDTVNVGDLIWNRTNGPHAQIGLIAWTDNTLSTDPACVRVIWLVCPVGDGQFAGTAATDGVLAAYLGFRDDDGHTWQLAERWSRVTSDWWEQFRTPTFR